MCSAEATALRYEALEQILHRTGLTRSFSLHTSVMVAPVGAASHWRDGRVRGTRVLVILFLEVDAFFPKGGAYLPALTLEEK